MTSCKDSGDGNGEYIQKDFWMWTWQSTITEDGQDFLSDGTVFKFTVKTDEDMWKATVNTDYKVKAGATYEYKFEAWTVTSIPRKLRIWYGQADDIDLKEISITNEHATYTFIGEPINTTLIDSNGKTTFKILCGDQKGSFSIKNLEIKKL